MTKNYEFALRETVRIFDVLTIFASFYLSYYIRNSELFAPFANQMFAPFLPLPITPKFEMEHFERILWLIVPSWLFLLSYSENYSFHKTTTIAHTFRSLLKVHFVGGFVIAFYVLATSAFEYKRSFFMMFLIFSFAVTFIVRTSVILGLGVFRTLGRINNRAIIIGTGEKAFSLVQELQNKTYWGFHITGLLAEEEVVEGKILDIPVLGSYGELSKILRRFPIDDVFIAFDEGEHAELKQILRMCENIGVNVHLIPDKYDLTIAKSTVGTIGKFETVTFYTIDDNLGQKFIKRTIDVAISLLLMVPLLIIFIIIGIRIKIESPGRIFYKSLRITRNRRPFFIYKFRTMIDNADTSEHLIAGKNEMQGPITKIKNDPRVTKIGEFLRRWSIDELPQIINVLMGEMSLVGPRPPTSHEVDKYSTTQLRKLSMPQGMTGLWQVTGRDSIDKFEDRLKLDLEYIDNWSLWLDFKIMLKTFYVVFKSAM